MTAKAGDAFRLDGFDYVITSVNVAHPNVTEFKRPDGLEKGDTPARTGACCTSDLKLVEPADYLSLVDEQAFALARGKPVMTHWARASAALLRDKPLAAASWTLPGRHLPKFPSERDAPATFEAACELARKVLNLSVEE